MRHVVLGRLKTSLMLKLMLLALLLTIPIWSVAATRYGDARNAISLIARERQGVAFILHGSALLEALATVRLEPRPARPHSPGVRMRPQDARNVADRLAAFAALGAELSDIGLRDNPTAPATAAWQSFEARPSVARLGAFGAAVLTADSSVTDASRLSFEPHVVEGNLGDALSTESGIILQRLGIASATAELGALRHDVPVEDRIAIATYVGSADAAGLSLRLDRSGAADDGPILDVPLRAAWNAFERSASALRRPLELVVRGKARDAAGAAVLRARKERLASATHRFVAVLDRQLGALLDARAAAGRRMQQIVIFGSLLAATLSAAIVALIGRVVVRRDRRELLNAQHQSRTLRAELAQQRAETALLLTQAQFSAIFERSNMGIALLDASGDTLEANARLKEMLRGADVIPPHDAAFAELINGSTATYHCERSLERAGARQWLEMTVSLVAAPAPAPVTAIAMLRDITERKALDQRLLYATLHDDLTSLANRAQFVDCLAHELADASRLTQFAVLFIDLDDFKLVNDTLGHHAGDQVLLVTARRIVAASRDVDLVARFHGDEFVVLLRELSGELAAEAAAERIRSELIAPMSIDGKLVVVSSSIGVVMGDGSHASAEELLRLADAAMYRAKSFGRSNEFLARRAGHLTSVSSIAS